MRILLLLWLFFLPICSVLLGVEIGVASGQCLGDQQSLLLQLKNSLLPSAPNSKKLVQWNRDVDCCSWDGVICDDGQRVTGLNLSGESISGGVEKSSLFKLQHLNSLDLSYNHINSTFPAGIGNLTNLTYLNLSNAGFGGQIPQEISQLTSLVSLEISTLPFWQISSLKLESPNLSTLVQNLSNLEELYLDGVNISARGNDWCHGLSSSVPKLRVLSLTYCYLSGPIHQSLGKLQSLSVIRLDNNNLSSPVPGFISNFSNLTSLRLSSCGLYGTFPKEIFKVPTLWNIDVSFNQLLHGSLPEFSQNNALRRVVLGSTNFSGKLPPSIGNLRNLSILDLSNCQFDGTLPSSMGQLTQLVLVDLSNNKFFSPIPSFKMSKNLTEIVLSHNSLTGAITSSHWEGLTKLLVVDLRNNLLNGSIPPSLFALPSLKEVQLSFNRFDGPLPEFQNTSTSLLEILDLSGNSLTGPIPMSIFYLKKLSILSLSFNKLNGRKHLEKFQVFHNLTTLDLSYNNLSVVANGNDSTRSSFSKISTLKLASCRLGIFPYLKNQAKLDYLDLSDNQIPGELPNWVWELGNGSLQYLNLSRNNLTRLQEPYSVPNSLIVLDLHLNNLHGKLPTPPQLGSYIDLSSNSFNSSIPADIGQFLLFSIFFSLSNNSLTGFIPESLCNASSIQVLDFSGNNLRGPIPYCIFAMSQTLGVLNLRRNNLTGKIPDEFSANCGLKTLDLNGNLIEGDIPKSLANCTELEVLNLGNNNLSGNFPCFLMSISSLRVVVLRSNKFQGSIGCHKTNETWAKLQIVDLAHNNFDGEIPREYTSKLQAMTVDEDDEQSKLNHIRYEFFRFSSYRYYQDMVTVTVKGLEMELQKILTLFTSIDLSCNNFSGEIPDNLGSLQALYILNLSSNAFTGKIPSSIGYLRQLESLDLSSNNLSGSIPTSLQNLTFLSFLNLSFNQLHGKIPTGSQLQTFTADSYKGNKALCGFPLISRCPDDSEPPSGVKTVVSEHDEFDWQSIYSGIGFGLGSGAVVALLMFWDEGKNWLENRIDKILLVILPMLGYAYKPRDEWDDEDDTEDAGSDSAEDDEEDESDDEELRGRYCVFCSKLDITRTRVIHDPRCTCHSSPPSSSSSFSSSTSSHSP